MIAAAIQKGRARRDGEGEREVDVFSEQAQVLSREESRFTTVEIPKDVRRLATFGSKVICIALVSKRCMSKRLKASLMEACSLRHFWLGSLELCLPVPSGSIGLGARATLQLGP